MTASAALAFLILMVRAVSRIDRLAWQAMRLSARNGGLAVEIDELKQLDRLSGRSPLRITIEVSQRSFRGAWPPRTNGCKWTRSIA